MNSSGVDVLRSLLASGIVVQECSADLSTRWSHRSLGDYAIVLLGGRTGADCEAHHRVTDGLQLEPSCSLSPLCMRQKREEVIHLSIAYIHWEPKALVKDGY